MSRRKNMWTPKYVGDNAHRKKTSGYTKHCKIIPALASMCKFYISSPSRAVGSSHQMGGELKTVQSGCCAFRALRHLRSTPRQSSPARPTTAPPPFPSYPTQHEPAEVGGPRWERIKNPTECNPPHHRPRHSVPSATLIRPIISSRLSPRPDRSIHRTVIPRANPTSERLETASHLLRSPRPPPTPATSAQ